MGTRQAGKSYLLDMMAVEEAAMNGGQVAYLSHDPRMDHVSFQNCLSRAMWLYPDLIEREYRSRGKQRIVFKNGGEIKFIAADMENEYDLCCLDDVPAERMVKAKRSIRSVLW